jgi:hypothetical protein
LALSVVTSGLPASHPVVGQLPNTRPIRQPSTLQLRGLAQCSHLCFNERADTMWVNGLYSSAAGPCGISIFSRHLRSALMPLGVNLFETNFRTSTSVVRTRASVVHYVRGFASAQASGALTQFLVSSKDDEKILIILHGLHSHRESRFQSDAICPGAARGGFCCGSSRMAVPDWRPRSPPSIPACCINAAGFTRCGIF